MKASPSEQSGSSWIPKGMELGVLGLTKNARRVLVIPPDLAVVSDSNSYSDIDPKNAATAKTLVAFVRLLSVKHKKVSKSMFLLLCARDIFLVRALIIRSCCSTALLFLRCKGEEAKGEEVVV